jgi:hypothetical protein
MSSFYDELLSCYCLSEFRLLEVSVDSILCLWYNEFC